MAEAQKSRPYHGPVMIISLQEAKLINTLLRPHTDEVAAGLRSKCRAALGADPKWRIPVD